MTSTLPLHLLRQQLVCQPLKLSMPGHLPHEAGDRRGYRLEVAGRVRP